MKEKSACYLEEIHATSESTNVILKVDLLCFSLIFCKYIMVQMAKASNNEVHVCKSNPCEQKPHSATKSFFYSRLELTSTCAGFLYMVICSRHITAVFTLDTLPHVAIC